MPVRSRSARLVLGVALATLVTGSVPAYGTTATTSAPRVFRVGTWNGIAGDQPSIEAAVAAAGPGDWILVGPGDYHPRMDYADPQRSPNAPAGVLITTPGLHLRGMDRTGVVIDGTRPGAAPCSPDPADQDYGIPDAAGKPSGRNGVEALLTSGVTFDNFTVCNFLSGSADSGNEIWWNGGDDSGRIGLGAWWGSFLSATSTFYDPGHPESAAQYGLFVSNSDGPGSMTDTYASNFSDSGYYIGACGDCNAVIDRGHAEFNALGYSGTNSGGHLLVQNSEFDDNKDGFDTNSQNSADPPSPQDGTCPNGETGPTGTRSCWVFRNNYVHDNNNPDVPGVGVAGSGPVGTGISLAGARNDTVVHNRFVNNGSWAVLTTVFPDTAPASASNVPDCHGGVLGGSAFGVTVPCLYDVWGNEIADNTFTGNGGFGNPTNGDLADLSLPPAESPGAPGDCFHGNTGTNGVPATSWPLTLQITQGTCGWPVYPDPGSDAVLAAEVGCATQALFPCPPNLPAAAYPRRGTVVMPALPRQPTMADPCAGVPVSNPWCPDALPAASAAGSPRGIADRYPAAVFIAAGPNPRGASRRRRGRGGPR
ncbi:right-handed parallel beta-helix repeat-containing protein [Amycolatopsis cynarae]|uniref:Right-handed parallel beta-helix repeat-containing protein n=1 Tax=Amycolatopsis cynarae TaxID=2995223 RepID=A0ABY7BAI4_9PSEU|nr:right-handed parallel beta-helix repeat-containing protein [Amycolatopsis sp. HUAS 11-8]WAL68688.1 right-handed parallel beta-helix repeat-containing protein [Amycolatopsis sp. HUAS 11-8]